MRTPEQRGYAFHGSAFAWGGQITRPFSEVLEVQAASALPSIGGFGSARADKYNYRDLIRFESAHSWVTGSSRDNVRHTLATVTIEGLNILNMVTADRVVARATSSHNLAAKPEEPPCQVPVGSYFVNLRIAGVPVDPKPHRVLLRTGKFSDLEGKYHDTDSPFLNGDGKGFRFPRREVAKESQPEPEGAAKAPQPKDREVAPYRRFEDCCLFTSIFQDLKMPDAPFETKPGCAIQIEDFGRITLGRYIITRESRRLTMILLELGCPVDMTGAGGEIIINGNPSGP